MAPITNQPLLQAEATLAAETNKRVVNRSIPTAIAKQAEGWRTGRTGAGRTRERPCARSTKKQWGASARIAHHGRAPSTDAAVRGRIYVSSRTSSPKNGVLATGEGSIYGRSSLSQPFSGMILNDLTPTIGVLTRTSSTADSRCCGGSPNVGSNPLESVAHDWLDRRRVCDQIER